MIEFAGIFDQNGWMGVYLDTFKKKTRFKVWIKIRSVDKALIETVQQAIYTYGIIKKAENKEALPIMEKDGFFWLNFQGGTALRIIQEIYPSLVIQKLQADGIFELQNRKKFAVTGKKLPLEEVAARMEIRKRIYEMNKTMFIQKTSI